MARGQLDPRSLLKKDQLYHVFLSYAQPDAIKAERIADFLKSHDLECMLHERDFMPGDYVINNINTKIKQSRRMLLLVTESYIKSDWCQAEIMYAIHECKVRETNLLIPVVDNLPSEKVPHSIRCFTYIDVNQPDAHEKILHAITDEDKAYMARAPCGSVAQGLAWSYYYGYLKIVLPGLRARCKEWWGQQDFGRDSGACHILVPRLFILIPQSGYCWTSLTESDPLVVQLPHFTPEVRASRAGIADRSYKNTVYRICHNGNYYYIPCEYATPVLSMYEMEKDGLVSLTLEEKEVQIRMFYDILLRILESSKDLIFQMSFHLILYRDTTEDNCYRCPISKHIVKVLDEEVEQSERTLELLKL